MMWSPSRPARSAAVLAVVLAVVLVVVLTAAVSCGGSDLTTSPGTAPAPATTAPEPSPAATVRAATVPSSSTAAAIEPVDIGRVVVLAEEWLLADVLALGIPVVASSATVPSVGFQGMPGVDTLGIELFDYLNVSLEQLAALRADHVIVGEFIVDYLGDEQVAGIQGELVVVPDGSTGPERIRLLGEAFGRSAQADLLVAELDAAYSSAVERMSADCDVSVAAIYVGPNVAAFAAPVWDVPRAIDRLGCRLVPGVDEVETDANGRAFLSLEQLGLLSGSTMVLLQTDTVEGERDAIADVQDGPIWNRLPSVAAGTVIEIDRLGYPGIRGEIRLVNELAGILGG